MAWMSKTSYWHINCAHCHHYQFIFTVFVISKTLKTLLLLDTSFVQICTPFRENNPRINPLEDIHVGPSPVHRSSFYGCFTSLNARLPILLYPFPLFKQSGTLVCPGPSAAYLFLHEPRLCLLQTVRRFSLHTEA